MVVFDATYSLEPGHLFEGKYRILRELGRGGFGMVYLAFQVAMDRHVALKVLKPGVGSEAPSARERFLREVKIISKLRHPNTVTIHDYGETFEGVVYMVLEFVEGATLKDILRAEGAQPPMRALALTRQITRSLAEAHRHGIVHRDLKPANIMVTDLDTEPDFVKVLDFGVARLLGKQNDDLTSIGVPEGERALIGTPRYMSPEQVRGESLTGASDLYGMGLILYEMLVGEPAVQGDTTMGLISQQLTPEPLRLPSLMALHPLLQDLIRTATQKNIARRFRSAEEFCETIDHAMMALSQEQGYSPATGGYFAVSGNFNSVPRTDPSGVHPHTPRHTHQHTPRPRARGPHHAAAPAPAAGLGASLSSSTGAPSGAGAGWIQGNLTDRDFGTGPASGALSPAESAPFVGNQVDYEPSEEKILGIPSSELPLPPDAYSNNSPFAPVTPQVPAPPTAASSPGVHTTAAHATVSPSPKPPPRAGSDDNLISFAFTVVKLIFLSILSIFFCYITFITTGALLGDFAHGTVKLGVASTLALSIPIFTALGENSQKERFHVVKRPTDRLARIFIGTTIFAAAACIIMSFAMAGRVTDFLRNDPNWFFRENVDVNFEPTPVTEANRSLSYTMADGIEVAMTKIGLYDGQPTAVQGGEGGVIAPPPASTRPRATPPGSPEPAAPAPAPQPERRTSPAPTRPSMPAPTRPGNIRNTEKDDTQKGDYVRW
ncbi:serine/threonine protein kinase [Lujinxingia sediminis]|uniref:Serine/threonine protein kinase n=1 Tax=Lujinxingia sediminis TaxID=2480984 RepID=A0ABY0CWN8_9DELT|nr:serine/threonine-protein kinase [Lujinxingia sediminis]RVU48303.1 serine/threonine protein kinase [Lujinxingia sediminis]